MTITQQDRETARMGIAIATKVAIFYAVIVSLLLAATLTSHNTSVAVTCLAVTILYWWLFVKALRWVDEWRERHRAAGGRRA